MKIAIIGTRGIPNHYGGFEQITEQLATGLVEKGHNVTVYNSHNHPNGARSWKGVTIQHCYDPEHLLGTAGQFVYDLNCIRHARKNSFDVWLFMGYTSSSVWHPFFSKNSIIVSNMDGMEWKRTKYSKTVQRFLKYAENLAVNHSHFHVADSPAVKDYLDKKYSINAKFIPYGAVLPSASEEETLRQYNLAKDDYFLLMARMEPENNVEMILEGFSTSNCKEKFLVIGKIENRFGKHLRQKYASDDRVKFIGGIFDQKVVHALRANAQLYFHGHSVGGTNPSLLEAMASGSLIAAHDNVFNKAVLGDDAFYFDCTAGVKALLEKSVCHEKKTFTLHNTEKIRQQYSWNKIIDAYENYFFECSQSEKNESYVSSKRWAYK